MLRRRPFSLLRSLAIAGTALALAASAVGPAAAVDPTHTLVPIGSAYEPDTLQLFAEAAAEHDTERAGRHPRPADHVLPERDVEQERRAAEEPHARRQPAGTGRDGLQRGQGPGADVRRAARAGPRPGRCVPPEQPRLLHAGRGWPVHPGWRPDGRDGRRGGHADGRAHGPGVRGGRRGRRQQRRRCGPVRQHDQRLYGKQRPSGVAAPGRGRHLGVVGRPRSEPRTDLRPLERHHRPACLRVRPPRPFDQRRVHDRSPDRRHGRRDGRRHHG